jgi:hypothetical protein
MVTQKFTDITEMCLLHGSHEVTKKSTQAGAPNFCDFCEFLRDKEYLSVRKFLLFPLFLRDKNYL